jgi:NADH dehydrogenase [ubiquinone] 1 alpha subcomplex assembly factor 5
MSAAVNQIFDAKAVRRHRTRGAAQLGPLSAVLDDLAARLLDRLDDTKVRFGSALEIGGRGAVAAALAGRGCEVVSADFAAAMAAQAGGLPVAIDGEAMPFGAAAFDLVVAHLSLHWVNDLPGALLQLRRALKPGGLFLASMPVLGTLAELRTALLEAEVTLTGGASPRVSPYPELRDCASLLQRAGFALPVADLEELEFLYANPLDLLQELRAAGETNAITARSRTTPPRDLFPLALSNLPQRDGRAIATLRMAIMTGWNA